MYISCHAESWKFWFCLLRSITAMFQSLRMATESQSEFPVQITYFNSKTCDRRTVRHDVANNLLTWYVLSDIGRFKNVCKTTSKSGI